MEKGKEKRKSLLLKPNEKNRIGKKSIRNITISPQDQRP
jgi:hypothetical protein